MEIYANDTLIYIVCKSDNIDDVTVKVQEALNQMFNWCIANKLSINLSETKYLTVKHVQSNIEVPVIFLCDLENDFKKFCK